MTILIVHLSDVHFTGCNHPISSRYANIKESIVGKYPRADACFIVVSGDVANTGDPNEYEEALLFFAELRSTLLLAGMPQVEIVLIPGNHDCNLRSEVDTRTFVLDGIERFIQKPIDLKGLNYEALIGVHSDFYAFEAQLRGRELVPTHEQLYYQRHFNVAGKSIVFHCFNTAWLSRRNEVQGELYLPPEILKPNTTADVDLSVAVLHHPQNWLSADNYHAVRAWQRRQADLNLTGHEHVYGVNRQHSEAGQSVDYVEASALYDPPTGNSGFQVISCDFGHDQQKITKFEWQEDTYREVSTSEWQLKRNPGRPASPFQISQSWNSELQNIGTGFKHPRKSLSLRDLFIYPDLRHLDLEKIITGKDSRSPIIPGETICDFIEKHRLLVVYGADDSGKSSLAKILYGDFANRNYVPLMIQGEDLKGCKSMEKLQALLRHAVTLQYGSHAVESFDRLDPSKRFLLIDNFHLSKLTQANKKIVADFAVQLFGTIVLFASDLFRIQELGRKQGDNPFSEFEHCDLKEFGILHRQLLIERWHYLGREDSSELEDLIPQIAITDKTIATLLGKNVLPHYPVTILSLLQLLEMNETPNTANGSYGYLYEVLIKAALGNIKQGSADVDLKVTYLSGIAFEMFRAKRSVLTEAEFRRAHTSYCERYDMIRDFSRMVSEIQKAEIIEEANGIFRFKYPYIFYYFVAKYFQENATALRLELRALADHIYRDVNANILIFYVYLTKDPELISYLVENSKKIYEEHPPCDLEEHVEFVNRLYKAPPKLSLPDGDVRKHREERARKLDAAKETDIHKRDDEEEDYEYAKELEDVIKINISFKTLQILGQVLRNFPGSLPGSLKLEITKECYDLGMRTLKALLAISETNLEALREYISGLIAERTDLREDRLAAQTDRAIIWLTLMAGFGTIKRISYAVGHHDLAATYAKVLESNESLANRIIDLSIRLDHFNTVPEIEMKRLHSRMKDNLFAYTVTRDIVGEFLYLYRIDYPMMQKLGALWDIEISSPKYLINRSKKT